MAEWRGPGRPFDVLFAGGDDRSAGPPLPAPAQAVYGDWRVPAFGGRAYVYANFVISRDGRVSFGVPGALGGGAVSGFNRHDQWLMGLLRARADAIVVGDNTLRSEPEHLWTAAAIFPDDATAFAALRRAEGRRPQPLQVVVSRDGHLAPQARIFRTHTLSIVIATTQAGAATARAALGALPHVEYPVLGEQSVDLDALLVTLHRDYGASTVLCEGGPTLYGALVQAGAIDDEFLTLSPILIGSPREDSLRPSLIEGASFAPRDAPRSRLLGVRRAGDYLFLHTRYR